MKADFIYSSNRNDESSTATREMSGSEPLDAGFLLTTSMHLTLDCKFLALCVDDLNLQLPCHEQTRHILFNDPTNAFPIYVSQNAWLSSYSMQ